VLLLLLLLLVLVLLLLVLTVPAAQAAIFECNSLAKEYKQRLRRISVALKDSLNTQVLLVLLMLLMLLLLLVLTSSAPSFALTCCPARCRRRC